MQLSIANDVKIYNLSAGKSIPEWISDRRRRKLEQKDIDIRRRIQLIQDFDMPDVSHTVNVTPDGRYVFATGTYKPYVKCFDLNDISLKFSRGLDADVIKMLTLSDDYSKFVLLQEDRYLEMHAAYGRYFRMRIPKFGRDMAFSRESSDLFIVGSGNEIYRLNLEQGRFLEPLVANTQSLCCCEFNAYHELFVCGTICGRVEAWDHRDRSRVGSLDCAPHALISDDSSKEIPQITAVKFKDALHLAVGTSTGKVLMYDIRSNRPLYVKDHQMGLAIRRIDFVSDQQLVMSMDSRVLKMWNENDGKPFAAIEPGTALSDFCRYPNSGLLFFANEAPKMLQYFIPAIGTAPKWCSYLETITEELEETEQPAVYDDYKFVTAQQLEDVGLSYLIGTNLVRAYMHGYFVDIRLYNKAKTLTQPFAYDSYKQRKLKERMDDERANESLIVKKRKEEKKAAAAKVNKELAAKLEAEMSLANEKVDRRTKKKGKEAITVLTDQRFASLFMNPDFEIDPESEQYKLINPALKKLDEKKKRLAGKRSEQSESGSDNSDGDENAYVNETTSSLLMDGETADGAINRKRTSSSSSSSSSNTDGEEDEDEEEEQTSEEEEGLDDVQNKIVQKETPDDYDSDSGSEEKLVKQQEEIERRKALKPKGFKLIELDVGEDASQFIAPTGKASASQTLRAMRAQMTTDNTGGSRAAVAAQAAQESNSGAPQEQQTIAAVVTPFGGRQITYRMRTRGVSAAVTAQRIAQAQEAHLEERKALHRGAKEIKKTLKPLPPSVRGVGAGASGGGGANRARGYRKAHRK